MSDIHHFVSYDNNDRALCGADLSEEEWDDSWPPKQPICEECDRIDMEDMDKLINDLTFATDIVKKIQKRAGLTVKE